MAFYCALICKCEHLVDIYISCRKLNVSPVYRLTQGFVLRLTVISHNLHCKYLQKQVFCIYPLYTYFCKRKSTKVLLICDVGSPCTSIFDPCSTRKVRRHLAHLLTQIM